MKRAIIIHGWEETPQGQWIPWLKAKLQEKGWKVATPQMPDTKTPKLNAWMKKLEVLTPNKDTILVGHSLANALIMKYLEKPNTKIKGAVLVAAWDWLIEKAKEFHLTFFETGFNYEAIKKKSIPIIVINSTTDPWIDFKRSRLMAAKINAKFISIKNAGHFMIRDGYKEFPKLLKIIEKEYAK